MSSSRILLAAALIGVVFCEERIFSLDQISCVATRHDLSKHYDACKLFRRKIVEKGGVVTCKIDYDADNRMMSGCTHAFGAADDIIKVDYVVSYNTKIDAWTLTANVLLWHVYHPTFVWFAMSLMVVFIIMTCMFAPLKEECDPVDAALIGTAFGMSLGSAGCDSVENISWNSVKED